MRDETRLETVGRVVSFRTADGIWVSWPDGDAFVRQDRPPARSRGGTSEVIRAPMTGRVVRVVATLGGRVDAGELLAVLEAMKMEYRLVAPHPGTVRTLAIREGDRVELGAILAEVAPDTLTG